MREPKFVTDRWISPKVAKFFYNSLRQDIRHVDTRFPSNTSDVTWLRWAAEQGRAAITADLSIARAYGELQDVKELGNIVFLVDINHCPRWDRFELLVRSWRHMKELVKKTETGPVVYRIGKRGLTNSVPEKNAINI